MTAAGTVTVACHQSWASAAAFRCNDDYGDCNGIVDDGCEAYFREDPKNCGGCGIVCSARRSLPELLFAAAALPARSTCGNDGCVDLNSNDRALAARCEFRLLKNQPDGGLPTTSTAYVLQVRSGTSCGELKCVQDNTHTGPTAMATSPTDAKST